MASSDPLHLSPFTIHLIVTTTLPTESDAQFLAEAAITGRLAACAQVEGPIRSTFRWQGAIDHATEWYCHFKTTRQRLPALEAMITEMHPYDVPEIIAVPIIGGSAAYLKWIEEETG